MTNTLEIISNAANTQSIITTIVVVLTLILMPLAMKLLFSK